MTPEVPGRHPAAPAPHRSKPMTPQHHEDQNCRMRWDGTWFSFEGRLRDLMAYLTAGKDRQWKKPPWKVGKDNRRISKEYYEGVWSPEGWNNGHGDRTDWLNGNGDIVAESIDDLKGLMERGWIDGVERLSKLVAKLRKIVPEAAEVRPRHQWQAEGDELDIHRVWSGEHDTMWWGRSEAVTTAPRTVSLLTPMGGHAGRNASELFWNGAASVVLVKVLEDAGYRVALRSYCAARHAYGGSGSTNGNTACVITLKSHGQAARIAQVAAGVACAAVYRGAGFRFRANAPVSIGDGWGQPIYADTTEDLRKFFEDRGVLTDSDILLGEIRDEESAVAEIKRVIALVEARR